MPILLKLVYDKSCQKEILVSAEYLTLSPNFSQEFSTILVKICVVLADISKMPGTSLPPLGLWLAQSTLSIAFQFHMIAGSEHLPKICLQTCYLREKMARIFVIISSSL